MNRDFLPHYGWNESASCKKVKQIIFVNNVNNGFMIVFVLW